MKTQWVPLISYSAWRRARMGLTNFMANHPPVVVTFHSKPRMWTSIFGSSEGKVVKVRSIYPHGPWMCVQTFMAIVSEEIFWSGPKSQTENTDTSHNTEGLGKIDNIGSTPFYSLHSFYVQALIDWDDEVCCFWEAQYNSVDSPVNPVEHRQENLPTLSTQVAPFLQGCEAHSSTSIWQWAPWKPGTQKQA